jgi:hypothetical protein
LPLQEEPSFSEAIRLDMIAVMDRDPACRSYLDALLYFKGFQVRKEGGREGGREGGMEGI